MSPRRGSAGCRLPIENAGEVQNSKSRSLIPKHRLGWAVSVDPDCTVSSPQIFLKSPHPPSYSSSFHTLSVLRRPPPPHFHSGLALSRDLLSLVSKESSSRSDRCSFPSTILCCCERSNPNPVRSFFSSEIDFTLIPSCLFSENLGIYVSIYLILFPGPRREPWISHLALAGRSTRKESNPRSMSTYTPLARWRDPAA